MASEDLANTPICEEFVLADVIISFQDCGGGAGQKSACPKSRRTCGCPPGPGQHMRKAEIADVAIIL